jgi:hypothetical protein
MKIIWLQAWFENRSGSILKIDRFFGKPSKKVYWPVFGGFKNWPVSGFLIPGCKSSALICPLHSTLLETKIRWMAPEFRKLCYERIPCVPMKVLEKSHMCRWEESHIPLVPSGRKFSPLDATASTSTGSHRPNSKRRLLSQQNTVQQHCMSGQFSQHLCCDNFLLPRLAHWGWEGWTSRSRMQKVVARNDEEHWNSEHTWLTVIMIKWHCFVTNPFRSAGGFSLYHQWSTLRDHSWVGAI